MKTVVSTCARVKVFITSCCFNKFYYSNETVQSIKTPAVHVRCDLVASLSWNLTGNVLSKCVVCLIISYLTLRPT